MGDCFSLSAVVGSINSFVGELFESLPAIIADIENQMIKKDIIYMINIVSVLPLLPS